MPTAPVTTVLAGSLMVPIDRAGAALTAVCDATAAMPDLLDAAAAAAAPLSELVIRPLGGAIAAPPADASPFSFRHAGLLLEVIAGWLPGDDRGPAHRAWMQDAWARLARRSAGGPDISHLGPGRASSACTPASRPPPTPAWST